MTFMSEANTEDHNRVTVSDKDYQGTEPLLFIS